MRNKSARTAARTLAIALLLLTAACVEERVVEQPAPQTHVVYVRSAPPEDIVEMQPPPPDERPYWVWQKGHWRWNGTRYYWTKGHWVMKPPHYNEWIAPHWENHTNGWIFIEGRWQ